MIISERDSRKEHILTVARQIMTAGRTAPKAKGQDDMEIMTVIDEDIELLAEAMQREADRTGLKFLLRDADNVSKSDAVILVGARNKNQGLNCGYCGYDSCALKSGNSSAACAINHVDVGIALGSMCATATDLRVDSRIMFSIGLGARDMKLMQECHSIYGLPISISSKSPFFDRK